MENTEETVMRSPLIFDLNQITLTQGTEAVHKYQVGGADH